MTTLRRDADAAGDVGGGGDAADAPDATPPRWPVPWPNSARITTSVIATGAMHTGTPDPLAYQQAPVAANEPSAGQLIRFLRRHLRISQATLARRLGYSQQQVSNWEHDLHPLTSGVHRLLMEVLLEAHEREERRYEQLRSAQRQSGGYPTQQRQQQRR